MRVLVTGGAGFIGHHLVMGLLASGHEPRVLDDLSTGRLTRLAAVGGEVAFFEGSVLETTVLDAAIAGCDAVLHQAAIASVDYSIAEPRKTDAVNVGGTIEVMLAAARQHVRRVVIAGSAAIYGDPVQLPCRESMLPAPRSPYAASKLAAEQYGHVLGELHGVETVVLRYFNVFGPGQDPSSPYAGVVAQFINAAVAGERPVVTGDGSATRDFIYVEDVVRANILAIEATGNAGLTCNIATGQRRSLMELLDAIGTATGTTLTPDFVAARLGDITHSQADVAISREALGWVAEVPFREAIARTVAAHRDEPRSPRLPSSN